MINPNKFIGLQQQESMGPLTDPQSFQQQFNVNRFTQPLAVPGDQNQTMSPVMQTDYPHADPNKGRPYVVNKEKTGTSKDTLFLPKDAYVSKGGYMDDVEYEQEAKTAAAKGIYNYTKNSNFANLEGSGKVKYKN